MTDFPSDTRYTRQHEWIRLAADGATVGITQFAQSELGDIVFVECNGKGKAFKQDEVYGTIEAVKTVSDLFMPVAGTITDVNPLLADNPELVNSDPYGNGWIIKLRVDNIPDIEALLTPAEYQQLVS